MLSCRPQRRKLPCCGGGHVVGHCGWPLGAESDALSQQLAKKNGDLSPTPIKEINPKKQL